MKVKRTYRLEEEVISELDKLVSETGSNASEVVAAAIMAYGTCHTEVPYTCHTSAIHENEQVSPVNNDMLAILAKQLEEKDNQLAAKDQQIESLTKLAQSAHDSLQAAQVLNAADKPQMVLENIEQKEERKGFFQRLFGK